MRQLFLPRFQNMVSELRDHPYISTIDFDLPSPAKPNEIKVAKRLLAKNPNGAIETFYSEMNGFRLKWSSKKEIKLKNDENYGGSVEILPITEVMKNWQEVTWFEFEGGDKYKGVKPLDFFAEEACAALFVSEETGLLKQTIHYHYFGEFLYDTGYDFSAYIDRLLAARGYWYWIESLCVETKGSLQTQNFFRQMPLLFPNFEPSLFQPKAL